MHPAYTLGSMDALDRLGMSKHAKAGLMRELAVPMAAGGGLGAVGGAMAGGEGRRLEGALLGAGLGATGAGLGHGIGSAVGKAGVTKAEKGLAEGLEAAAKGKGGQELTGAARKGRMAKYEAGPEHAELQQAIQQATEVVPRTQRGGAMLGGVAGTGAGMGYASGLPAPEPTPLPPAMNPYGY